MSPEVRIPDSLLLALHNERTKLRVSAVDPKYSPRRHEVKMLLSDINL